MQLIFTIVGGALVLLSVYGAVTLNRKLFLSGICFFSILPFIGESMAYNADKAPIHIMVILLFLIQFVLAMPTNISYGSDNAAASKLTGKIALALLIVNIAGAVFILCLKAQVPAQFGYYHIVFSLVIIYMMIKKATAIGGWVWAK
jgi:hypothetical protein